MIRPSTAYNLAHAPFDRYFRGDLDDSYLTDIGYAADRVTLVRAYHMIERDLVHLFDYVEPTDENLSTFSHRLYELLVRASTEFETNCKAILTANGYAKSGNWNITDYFKINASSHMSDYKLELILWRNGAKVLRPFAEWSAGHSLSWYQDYNTAKHDRSGRFELAKLENVLLAVSSVFAMLFSQFYVLAFRTHPSVGFYSSDGEWFTHQNSIFAIKVPQWTEAECYDFDWSILRQSADRFGTYSF